MMVIDLFFMLRLFFVYVAQNKMTVIKIQCIFQQDDKNRYQLNKCSNMLQFINTINYIVFYHIPIILSQILKFRIYKILNLKMQKNSKFGSITDNLNKLLHKELENFTTSKQWTDLNNWLKKIESVLTQNPSPYISDKIMLSKRLNQCLNPILPQKVHQYVIKIHQTIFYNMKNSVDGNINNYIKLFAEDLGLYSVSLFPFFSQCSNMPLRIMCLNIFSDYYMDLGKQLIPLLTGLLLSILPVYGQATDQELKKQIQNCLNKLIKATGRRYYIGAVWMCILRFRQCRKAGIQHLQSIIPNMKFLPGQQELDQSHGFSEQQQQVRQQLASLTKGQAIKRPISLPPNPMMQKNTQRSLSIPKKPPNLPQKKPKKTIKQIVQESSDDEMSPLIRRPLVFEEQKPTITQNLEKNKQIYTEQQIKIQNEPVPIKNLIQITEDRQKSNHKAIFKPSNNTKQNIQQQISPINDENIKQIPKINENEKKYKVPPIPQNFKVPNKLKPTFINKMTKKQSKQGISSQKQIKMPQLQIKHTSSIKLSNSQSQKNNNNNIKSTSIIQKNQSKGKVQTKPKQTIIQMVQMPIQRARKIPNLDKVPYVPSEELELIKQAIQLQSQELDFPNKNSLILNALLICLEDPQPYVKRAALDFMYSHLRLKNKIFGQNQKKVLVEAVIYLFVKKELTITKRVNSWLFGKSDEQNKYNITDKNEFVLDYIVQGFQKILSREPKDQNSCIIPLKILQNFYIQHDHMVKYTLEQITLSIIRYIFNFGFGKDYSSDIMKSGQRFFQNIPSYYQLIFESLGKQLISGIQQENDLRCFQVTKYIDFCYIKLMKHDAGYQQLEYLTILLQKLSISLFKISELKSDINKHSFIKSAVLLVVNLLDRKEIIHRKINEERQKYNSMLLEQSNNNLLPRQRIQYEEQLINKQQQRQIRYQSISSNIQFFYIKLGKLLKTTAYLHPYQQTYKLCSMAIINIQRSLPKKEVKVLPEWFSTIQNGIQLSNPAISLSAIQSMIFCLTSESIHPIYNSFKSLILVEKHKKIGSDYQRLALQKLWCLLDFPHMHKKIIDLIVNFSKYFPHEFTDVVSKSFNTYQVPAKQAAIQRFSHFWRLTGYKYKDLLHNNHILTELNKVGLFLMLDFLQDSNPLVRHAAKNWLNQSMGLFYRVIDPLFVQLMQVGDNVYITPKGQHIISKKYDAKRIFKIFRKIRSILTSGSAQFLRYIYQTKITDTLQQLKNSYTDINFPIITKQQVIIKQPQTTVVKQPVLPKALINQEEHKQQQHHIQKLAYMDLLVIISIKYIQGHAIQSMGAQFHIDMSAVNASSIEFIESFLGYIDSPEICQRFINFIIFDLFKVLQQGVANRQYIIQVQLLNLFKTIFFNSSFRLKGEPQSIRKLFNRIFTSPVFTPSLLRGLNTPFSYVRTQFISFISLCIPLIADFLEPTHCTYCIKNILFSYYQIIKSVNMRLVNHKQEIHDFVENAPSQLKRIIQLKERAIKQQKIVRLTDNLNQVAKTNQILAILHGVSAILNYFYELNLIDYKKIQFTFTNPYTMFDTIKSIVTLGFGTTVKQVKLINKTVFLHNLQTCQAILKQIGPVFQTILRAWPLSEEYVRIATYQFCEIGVKSFGFQRFSKYNNVLKDLINYVSTQKQSIWGKIISIMRPMFYKFPKQIVSIYLLLWMRECPSMNSQGNFVLESERTQFLMKIVETLIVNDFPINILVSAFVQTPIVQDIKSYYIQRQKDQKKGNVLDYNIAQTESKLLYFLHVYFHYVYLNNDIIKKENLLDIWGLILKAVKPFFPSKNPNTNFWILEFINLCSKKYSPKQILSNERFKSQLHFMINEKLKFVAGIASKKFNFFYEQPRMDMRMPQKGSNPNDNTSYRIILPYTPSIYEQLLQRKKNQKQHIKETEINQELFNPIKSGLNEQIQRKNRFYAFKTLKRIGLELIQNTYMPQKNHWVIKRTKQWIDIILPVIEDKNPENMIFAQSASQVLHDLLDKAKSLFLKALKPDLLKIFNKDDFFICNVITLKYWSKIIDWVVNCDKNNETFSQYLGKVSLVSSYFGSQDNQNKKRVKSFERICFILYSGCKDRYANKIKGLLQIISEILKKTQSSHPALLILILFAIRILILRLSQISLNQLFIDIWPMILTLLIQLFTRKTVKFQIANQISKNPNLLLAALKLIQMISISNLSQFSHHQWIFMFDFFGIKLTVQQNNMEMLQFINANIQLKNIVQTTKNFNNTPFIYKPYLSNYFPTYSINYIPKPYSKQIKYEKVKRKMIVKQPKVQDQNQLRIRAIVLCQYLIQINQIRIQVDESEVEMLIVNDFISLDNFIHKI